MNRNRPLATDLTGQRPDRRNNRRWRGRREHGRDAPERVWQHGRSRQLALTYEWIEDWHRAIPRRYENYTHRQLEKFVQRCDQ
jgi:hypothetical protein